MTQIEELHRDAMRLSEEAETARRRGQSSIADEKLQSALDHALRAAELSARDFIEEHRQIRLTVHKFAALLALKCKDVWQAERLIWDAWKGRMSDKARDQLLGMLQQAESIWQETEAKRLGEISFKVPVDTVQIAFSRDSRYLGCAGHICQAGPGNIVSFYSLEHQRIDSSIKVEFKPETERGHFGINAICFSPDDKLIGLASFDGSVVVCDWKPPGQRHRLSGHSERARSVEFSPDGMMLASTGWDFRTKLWNPVTGKKLGSFKARRQLVDCVAFSPDAKKIVWGCEAGHITLLELDSRREIYTFRPHRDDVTSISFSACGRMLAAGCLNGTLKLFETDTGKEIATIHSGGSYLAFSPDGRLLASTSKNEVNLWDIKKIRCICSIRGGNSGRLCVAFSPDGRFVAASGHDSIVRIWPVAQLQNERSSPRAGTPRVNRPVNPSPASEWTEPASKLGPAPGKMPCPEHLEQCASPIISRCTRKKFVAEIRCPCGSEKFQLLSAGNVYEGEDTKNHVAVTDAGHGFFHIAKAKCVACQTEHLLFDQDFHGWNGFVCRNEAHLRPRPELTLWKCSSCGNSVHSAKIMIFGENKQVSIGESGGVLDQSNWQEGFGCIGISIRCAQCGDEVPDWLSNETM